MPTYAQLQVKHWWQRTLMFTLWMNQAIRCAFRIGVIDQREHLNAYSENISISDVKYRCHAVQEMITPWSHLIQLPKIDIYQLMFVSFCRRNFWSSIKQLWCLNIKPICFLCTARQATFLLVSPVDVHIVISFGRLLKDIDYITLYTAIPRNPLKSRTFKQ